MKRSGHSEPYHESKLHSSVVRACRSVRAFEGEALFVADRVCAAVTAWIDSKDEVTARDVRERALDTLIVHHAQAAYAYASFDSVL